MLVKADQTPLDARPCAECPNTGCRLSAYREKAAREGLYAYRRGERLRPAPAGFLGLNIVLEGMVALAAGLADGRRQLIQLETAGDLVCEINGSDGTVWLEALAPTTICQLDFPAALVRERDFLEALFTVTHGQLATNAGRMVSLGRLDGSERVCGFLLDMAHRIGRRRGPAWHLSLPMSREDIADYLGLNTETVSRILSRLKKRGIVEFVTPTEMILPELAALERRAAAPTFRAPGRGLTSEVQP